MRKGLAMILVLLLTAFPLLSIGEVVTSFTHPEIGEIIEYGVDNQMPYFLIYGFTQYKMIDSSSLYRGLAGYGSLKGKGIGIEETLKKLFSSLNGEFTEPIPVLFEYKGVLENYSAILELLPQEERIQAIISLSGFNGKDGYTVLQDLEGFSGTDVTNLMENHAEYTIELNGKEFPYRVLMFYFEEESWQEAYFERYAFVQQNKQWRLHQISKEYYSDYRDRVQYIHGLAGTNAANLQKAYYEILQGYNMHITPNNLQGAMIDGDKHVFSSASLFRLPAQATFTFENEWLSKVEYEFSARESYFPAFVSLYMRFYDPNEIDAQGNMVWTLPEIRIELVHDDEKSCVVITPRIDPSTQSFG